jgi:hypothetical protein
MRVSRDPSGCVSAWWCERSRMAKENQKIGTGEQLSAMGPGD